jgi:glycosyltransferase involved in cell wall biosynthesis
LAFESFDLSDYELLISNKSAFCHGVKRPPEALHICYCLTPTRFLWNYEEYVVRERIPWLMRAFLPLLIGRLRYWDRAAADRVDHFVAISQEVRERIKSFYERDSTVIYPPVDTERFHAASSPRDYFLIVSRLIPYKRIDIAIQAFNNLGLPLLIIGEGRDEKRLKAMAGPNINFLGRLPDGQLTYYLSRCRALVFPGQEDFGLVPLEAMACGRPVIAYAGGGALETVVEGETGLLFSPQSAEALAAMVRNFDDRRFDPLAIRAYAAKYDREKFKAQLQAFVEERWAQMRKGG